MMRYGAMQWILGPAGGALEAAVEIGFDGVELGYGDEGDLTTDPAAREATRVRAGDLGLEIPSLCIGRLNRGGFASEDPEVRQTALDLVRGSIEAAVDLGARIVLVPFFFQASPRGDAAAIERVIEHFRLVAPAAEREQIVLGYEGDLDAEAILEVLGRIGSPAVRCYYDVGNAVWLGYDPLEELRLLRERVCQVHFKEFTEKLNDRLLGEGLVPVAEACEVLREIGYDGWVVLETGTFGDPIANSRRQFAYLRQFI